MVVAMAVFLPTAVVSAPDEKAEKAGEEGKSEIAVVPGKVDVSALIAALADESFIKRQHATLELWSMGKDALPALRKALQGDDPEAADRADELILYISAGVLFDSSEEVKQLVLKFSRGGIELKLKILKKLTELGQWKQVLHLARIESDPDARKKMVEIVRYTATRAAREALVDGDLQLVDEILQLSGDSDQAMAMRAWFYCRQGKLDQELAKAATMPAKKATLWRLALYRASGDLTAATREAKKADRLKLRAALQVLQGNPKPWLARNADLFLQDVILSRSCQIQNARLDGDLKKANVLARELRQLAVNDDTTLRVIAGLAANGYREDVIELIERHDVVSAFDYHDSTESPQRALELLGMPKDAKPPYTKWVQTYTDRVIEAEDEDLYNRLLLLAGFLVRHGEGAHAEAVLEPLMTALEKDGSDLWFDTIAEMPRYELGPQAIKLLTQRGNEDGEADLGVRQLLGSSKSVEHLWKSIKKRNSQDIEKSLRDIALLAGLIADPEHETDALHQALVDEVAQKPVADQTERNEALFAFALKRHEVGTASKMVDGFVGAHDRWERTKLFLDTALLRWKKVEPLYAALEKQNPGDYDNLAKWSMVLRKLNQSKKAAEVLDRALLLTMGDAKAISAIAMQLSYAGYDEDAVSLWQQVAMRSEPETPSYDQAIVALGALSSTYIQQKSWKKAAAIAEVYSRYTMRGRSSGAVLGILNIRFKADFFKGMQFLKMGKRQRALKVLDACQSIIPGSGALADDFFPALRLAGVDQQYNQWFEQSYQHVDAACKLYPQSANTHNTAAWLASRAVRRLDDALRHAEIALELRPSQGAYIDTMAEVWFAKGDRKKAVEWSKKAVAASISHAQGNPRSESRVLTNHNELNKQLRHFKHDPMPK